MCGIIGEFAIEGITNNKKLFHSHLYDMKHRGPDAEGVWIDPDLQCWLGSVRLTIIDNNERSKMPMTSKDGRFILTYNGELYNYLDLRSDLEKLGYTFQTQSDTEVVLNSLIEWREKAFDFFNGMFSLGFYDQKEKSILIGRDHAGIKPIYYTKQDSYLFFASQYFQILKCPKVDKTKLSPSSIAMFLRLGYIPPPNGLVENTFSLPPGHWLKMEKNGKTKISQYYKFNNETEPQNNLKGNLLIEELNHVLSDVIKRQSISDFNVGCFLSGGIDSPLITSTLANHYKKPLHTFSIGLDDSLLDERSEAANYSKLIGTTHHLDILSEYDSINMIDDVFDAMYEPMADEGIIPTMLVSKNARKHAKVALSGEGADELFWGYSRRQSEILKQKFMANHDLGLDYLRFFNDFSKDSFTACFPSLSWWPNDNPQYHFSPQTPEDIPDWIRKNEYESYLPFILLKTDMASMFHSLEVRVPFLDRKIIELSQQFHFNQCFDIDNIIGKKPLRMLLNRRLNWQSQVKKGFTVPIDTWIRGGLKQQIINSLHSLKGTEIIDPNKKELWKLANDHFSGKANNGMALWRIFVLDYWIKKYLH